MSQLETLTTSKHSPFRAHGLSHLESIIIQIYHNWFEIQRKFALLDLRRYSEDDDGGAQSGWRAVINEAREISSASSRRGLKGAVCGVSRYS